MNASITTGRKAPIDPAVAKPPAKSGATAQNGTTAESRPSQPATDKPAGDETVTASATTPVDKPTTEKKGKATPALTDSLVVAWDTERIDETEYRETLLPDVHLDLEEVAGSWDGFPDFLKRLKAMQDASGEHKPVTLILNVHGNNGTGLKMVSYHREAADGEPAAGSPTREDASIASAAQINAWLKEAGFDPSEVTVISEVCNAGPAYLATVDGFNPAEKAAATKQAQRLAEKEHVALGEVTFLDAKAFKADLTYHWIGRKNGGNAAGTVFLQAATGMGTASVSGKVAAAPIVDLNKLGKPGKVVIAITGDRNPWPNDHFNELIDGLRTKAPRLFDPQPQQATNN
jgi:hypothetical protein